MKLWWSDISVSKTFEFLKIPFLFVKIKSMQFGLVEWKHVGFGNQTFHVKCAHKSFKVFIFNSEVEIPQQYNAIKLTS